MTSKNLKNLTNINTKYNIIVFIPANKGNWDSAQSNCNQCHRGAERKKKKEIKQK